MCSMPIKLRDHELHNHHQPLQRTKIPPKSLLSSFQRLRLPLRWWIKRLIKPMFNTNVQLHQPLWKLSTWHFLQLMSRQQSWACLRRSSTTRFYFQHHLRSLLTSAHSSFTIILNHVSPVSFNTTTLINNISCLIFTNTEILLLHNYIDYNNNNTLICSI